MPPRTTAPLVLGVMKLMGVGGMPAQLCVLLASLPVAVNINCHVTRRASVEL